MDRRQLFRELIEHFNMNELRALCFELDIDFENLGGEGKEAKARELIEYLERRNRFNELVAACYKLRPDSFHHVDTQHIIGNRLSSSVSTATHKLQTSVLFLAADPTDLSRLRLGEEIREIQQKLQLAKFRNHFALHQRMSVRPEDLTQALLDIKPQIVHFSGHGTEVGELCFENNSGNAIPIPADTLSMLFEQFASQVKCVVLNACFSKVQAGAIMQHIEHVIGMECQIDDKEAIAFSVGFYQALGAGSSINEAYKLGCIQIKLQGIPAPRTPVLLKKSS